MDIRKLDSNTDEQAELTRRLIRASEDYYNGRESGMSDLVFSNLVENLRKMEERSGFAYEGSPTIFVGAAAITELQKAVHKVPALSLAKVKYKDRNNLLDWMNKTLQPHEPSVLSWKMDGLTLVLTYKNGRLDEAATRGDGFTGSVVTHNARYFKGIPLTIPYTEPLTIRGEAVMKQSEFARVNVDGTFENARNLASATIQMLDSRESRKREICFYAFELVEPEPMDFGADVNGHHYDFGTMTGRLGFVSALGFQVVAHRIVTRKTYLDAIEEAKVKLPENDFPTDGLVFSAEDLAHGWALGSTGHHPRWSIAMKWTDETMPTTLRAIEWSVGKTGTVTPVAVFDPVRLGIGSNVTRASLHNISILRKIPLAGGKEGSSYLALGDTVNVYLANMIIPQIADYTYGDPKKTGMQRTAIEIPKNCPVCGAPLRQASDGSVITLHCDNVCCPARQLGNLMNTFSKDGLFVKGLGESQIEDLIAEGLVRPDDPSTLFRLSKSANPEKKASLLSRNGWGQKRLDNLMSAIEEARHTTFPRYLYSLNIPMLGHDLSRKLEQILPNGIEDWKQAVFGTKDDQKAFCQKLQETDGIGTVKAGSIAEWLLLPDTREKQEKLLAELNFAETGEKSEQTLANTTFVITGAVHRFKNRDAFKAYVEARGGKVAGSVSRKTNYLVNNDAESSSSKNKKAKELGIPILTEDAFIEKFGFAE